ncbi:hypothetical protein SBV1_2950030 [Verrucomicrobia bacterium]|nr:hypothetical protein SBV1_2950030 [Verrucomicrobiota bacterium]
MALRVAGPQLEKYPTKALASTEKGRPQADLWAESVFQVEDTASAGFRFEKCRRTLRKTFRCSSSLTGEARLFATTELTSAMPISIQSKKAFTPSTLSGLSDWGPSS